MPKDRPRGGIEWLVSMVLLGLWLAYSVQLFDRGAPAPSPQTGEVWPVPSQQITHYVSLVSYLPFIGPLVVLPLIGIAQLVSAWFTSVRQKNQGSRGV